MATTDNEEDDYMSDAFLNTETVKDVRPGLLLTHEQQRLHNQIKKRKECQLTNKATGAKALEEQQRQEGLEKAIDSTNKGFSLLQKMGYKPGLGIGKNNSGIVEPIGIVLKTDRKGLGREAALKQVREMKKKIIRSRLSTEPSVCEYRERRAQEASEKLDRSDLYRCQRVCRQMDLDQDILEPSEKFFWPVESSDVETDKPKQEEVEDLMSLNEQLEILNFYLRHTYNYCVYCGIVFNDESDLMEECPGPNRQDH
ncbi:G patch domain-containing protein 11 [Rhopalosiphum maidis]|uniref:G patch domain-containing protein 11 n=1 Tax=Rhopalosiphum maidis TaxID=43146 RepID=UPI000F006057|nr:G patch domain-containing protein 11 [Rhopalosiphum maidis]XP_026823188.1 G patch domain-containing protein 11 [Rhopalosiphum maidis]